MEEEIEEEAEGGRPAERPEVHSKLRNIYPAAAAAASIHSTFQSKKL